ncbi:hypothetical protein TSUD_169260 [Trifolium subterraneum]|nr:hypothetical protein TSUD_169260 [Trifolium subterraneum]
MGRAKHEHLWIHVRKVENGRKWICKHCNGKFSGGASRIDVHLGGKEGGGIRRCSNYHGNQGILNMASTSNNSPEVVINRVYSTQDQGVNLDDDDDERIRAEYLSSALEKKEKSILILDDVWKYIDLQKVGIHPKVNGIKVIVTSRLKHVCHQMDCQPYVMIQMFPLSCYNEDEYQYADKDEFDVDEDWDLFTINLGHGGIPRVLPYEIEEVARCIIKRFHGLPLGINVMARTMKGIDDIHQWKHALNKLKQLEMGQEVEEEVFKVLKRSYDNLKEKDLQNCFLYCALLSDYTECVDYELIMKLVDNGLIDGNRCLEEISDEVKVMLIKLGAHSLDYTHRLVKDMACYILKESKKFVTMLKFDNELTEIPPTHEWIVDLEVVYIECCSIKEIPDGMSPYCRRVEDIQGMKKLERLGGIFDIKDYHNYVQNMPELKMYYLIFGNLLNLPQLKIVCKRSIRCGSSKPGLSIDSCPELERYPTVKLIDCEIPYFGIFTTDIDPQLMLLDTLVNLQ